MTVRTRFAPSPTGLLHIGGARTALFNYLFSRHLGGQFLLRIEDTDRARSTEANTQAILDSLNWLGLERDEPEIYQSTRAARHAEVARSMLDTGHAYRCWATQEEIAAARDAARAAGKPLRFDSPWRDRTDGPDTPYAIRLRAPREGETTVQDRVQGTVTVANSELDDMIILRSDGTPTYQHAVVVDDHDMAITDVIRGDDHMTNTFRQIQVFLANGWDVPTFAHVPMIHGPDGAKLSKRHGAASVTDFRDAGYLPETMCNYLLRLGWAHGDAEILGRDEAIKLFTLEGVGKSPGRMDYKKLDNLNGVWLREADDDRLTADVVARLTARALNAEPVADRIRMLMPGLKERAKTLVELADNTAFLARTMPLEMDAKATALLTQEAKTMLRDVANDLAATDFSAPALDAAIRAYAERSGRKLGQVAQPLRAALTGTTTSPGIDVTLAALGRDEAVARLLAAAA
ncbi:glutamate--tRNA ligase [Acidisphaera sp. L21]|uniref:glutamate--tRNA ligase n=1 Tax=Acidisphaera sp. L21 TaxID=1641851 RepID=UPI00131E74F9|nr:glutamate--tRNA ligase [Acidisphaera sp. L21]